MNTRKNKIMAVIIMLAGLAAWFVEGDIFYFLFTAIIGIPLFFAKKSIVAEDYADYIIDKDGKIHKVKK